MHDWLESGPGIKDLVGQTKDLRGEKHEIAVIIPTRRKNEVLKRHLELLKDQTMEDFDVIVVYSYEDDFVDSGMGVLHVREKEDNGSAGAYYTGEKIALEDGYRIIILADNDCLPEADVIAKLVGMVRQGTDACMPYVRYSPGEKIVPGFVIHHYGCMRRNVLEKTGLTFLPLYFGAEDFELSDRISGSGFRIEHADTKVTHPIRVHFLVDERGSLYYKTRGELESYLITGRYYLYLIFAWRYLMVSLALVLIGRWEYGIDRLIAIWHSSGARFFKERNLKGGGQRPFEGDIKAEVVLDEDKETVQPPPKNIRDRLKRIISTLLIFANTGILGKRMHLINRQINMGLPQILMARSAYVRCQGRDYEIFKDRGMIRIIASLLLLAWALPHTLGLAFLLLLRGIISRKGITSYAYGIKKNAGVGSS